MKTQTANARRAVRLAAAGIAVLLAVAIALLPTPTPPTVHGRLTFAIAPGGGSSAPEDVVRTLAALRQLKPPGKTLVVHLYSGYAGPEPWARYRALLGPEIRSFEQAGFDVELVLRYAPLQDHGSPRDVDAFVALVRRVVAAFGADRRFVSVQITNEADRPVSPASDGYFNRGDTAWQALIRGVVAAKATADRRHFNQLKVGFNYAANNRAFWRYLRVHGGPAFIRALDWVGIDTYPGTLPPIAANHLRQGIAKAIALDIYGARHGYLPFARIPSGVALHVSENGYATSVGHSYAMQAAALTTAVEAVASLGRSEHVTEYDWFELRDASGSKLHPTGQFGLLQHDFQPKPAFALYRRLIGALS